MLRLYSLYSNWNTLLYHGCDPKFVEFLTNLYEGLKRRFRYAGCLGKVWTATNGVLQGDPLSVVILNCVLHPLLSRLSSIPNLTCYAFADDPHDEALQAQDSRIPILRAIMYS